MPDDLTNDQIALLCDIGEYDRSKLTEDKKRNLERLISGGYAERTESHPGSAFKLTAKGVKFLSERGAGLNEA
jgi:CTP-dependent riboflavin kinase